MKNDNENIILVKSFQFAVRIVNLYKRMLSEKKEFIISKQLVRSGTSIGANTKEGSRAQSKADFYSKMSIALKEASESEYWIELLTATGYLSENESHNLLEDCRELIRILIAITTSAKNNIAH